MRIKYIFRLKRLKQQRTARFCAVFLCAAFLLSFTGCFAGTVTLPSEAESYFSSSKEPLKEPSESQIIKTPVPEPEPEPAFLKAGKSFGENARRRSLNSLGISSASQIYPLGEKKLLLVCPIFKEIPGDGDAGLEEEKLFVYDLQTDAVTASLTLPSPDTVMAPQTVGDKLCICEGSTLTVYTSDLKAEATYSCGQSFYRFLVTEDLKKVYFTTYTEDGETACYEAALDGTGGLLECRRVFDNFYITNVEGLTDKGRKLVLKGVDKTTFLSGYYVADVSSPGNRIVYEAGQYSYAKISFSKGKYYINYWDAQHPEKNIEKVIDSSTEEINCLETKSGIAQPEGSPYLIQSERNEDGELSALICYSDKGEYVSSVKTASQEEYILDEAVYLEKYGCFAALYSDKEDAGLLFWFLEKASDEKKPGLAEYKAESSEPPEESGELAPLYQKAENMSKKYGVRILIGKEGALENETYEVSPLMEYKTIDSSLTELDTVMSRFPEGFFRQLRFGDITEVRIALAGTISAKDEGALSLPAAYVTERNSRLEMVIDASYSGSMAINFYHEISHMIDRRLEFVSLYKKDSAYSEEKWQSYNPEGFTYGRNYGTAENQVLTPELEPYFITGYSLSFATEDRAELMRYAIYNLDLPENMQMIRNKPKLRAKYDYYCRCIRQCFNTAGWPDVTIWEEVLQ